MSDEARSEKMTDLMDKRIELAMQATQLQLEALKVNRELIRSGASLNEIERLHNVAFCW